MMTHTTKLLSVGVLLSGLVWLGASQAVWAAERSKGSKSGANRTADSAETQKRTFRLPRYFSSIVDDEQKSEIREIQISYYDKIQALRTELAELQAEELEELEAVLTSTQRKTLNEMRSEATKSGTRQSSRSKKTSTGGSKSKSTGSSSSKRSGKSSSKKS